MVKLGGYLDAIRLNNGHYQLKSGHIVDHETYYAMEMAENQRRSCESVEKARLKGMQIEAIAEIARKEAHKIKKEYKKLKWKGYPIRLIQSLREARANQLMTWIDQALQKVDLKK